MKNFIEKETGKKIGLEAEKYIQFYINQFATDSTINLNNLLKTLKKNKGKIRVISEEDEEIMIKDMSADVLPKPEAPVSQ